MTEIVERRQDEKRKSDKSGDSRLSKGSSSSKSEDDSDFDWPYEITIDLTKSPKPKVAFLSGEERQYYPENPGHTRMGVEFAMNCAPGDVPNPNYYPPILGIHKPISLIGYGIGGLLAKRFPKDVKSLIPDAGTYQKIIDRRVVGISHPYSPTDPILRYQCRIGFGSGNRVPRFGIERTDIPPGPGSYDVIKTGNKCPCIKRAETFGGKRYLIPSVLTICIVDGGEKCCECGQVQLADYYRSSYKLRHPEKKRASILAMCRKCYCKAYNGQFTYWTAGHQGASPLDSLRKVRHCNYIHDHQKLSQFIHKTTCKEVNGLFRKELKLNKYYSDCCPPEYTHGKK